MAIERTKHINTRNLIVVESADEFARVVEALDFKVEDVVGYITSISRNFYWLNAESVWGVLGFTWDHLEDVNDEEALIHPNPLYRLTQVDANGDNIEMDEQWLLDHRIKKGYGHFNATTIPFTVIPTLPDGYRITAFKNTFDQIESDYIEVLKSDWSNLVEINNLIPRGKSIKIDITGASLSSTNNTVIVLNSSVSGYSNSWKDTIYIKGTLQNCTRGIFEWNSYNNWTASHTILLDDDNKDLKLPVSLRIQNQFYYRNSENIFDIKEWLSINDFINYDNYEIRFLSDSGKYYIDNKFARQIQDVGNIFAISPIVSNITATGIESFKDGIFIMKDPVAMEVTPCTVTIDCTENGDVREDKLFIPRVDSYGRTSDNKNIYEYTMLCLNPIIYQGAVNSITMWNPFCLVKDDDSWPAYDQNVVDKLRPISERGIGEGYFMRNSYIYITQPSPYTIDCTNLTHLSLFNRARFFISDFSNLEKFKAGISNCYCMEVVKLTYADDANEGEGLISFGIGDNPDMGDIIPVGFYFKINSNIKTVFFGNSVSPKIVIGKNVKIELAYAQFRWYDSIKVEDITHVTFKFRYINCKERYGMPFTIKNGFGYNHIEEAVFEGSQPSSGPINLYEFDQRILDDVQFLKESNIYTFYNTSREVVHPLIATNSHDYNGGTVVYRDCAINISSDFIFIYRQNIKIYGYNGWSNITNIVDAFVNKILQMDVPNRGIIPNDTADKYTITLSMNIFDALTEEQKTYIRDTLNYELVSVNE